MKQTLKWYGSDDTKRAIGRWKVATKNKDTKAFMEWLGFSSTFLEYENLFLPDGFSILIGTPAYRKMEMLLNPHWYTLMKANEAREVPDQPGEAP